MYSGRRNVKIKQAPAEFKPDLSSTSRARRSLVYAQKNLKPEAAADVEKAVTEAFPDMLVERRRIP